MEKHDDAPKDVKRATPVDREIRKGQKDDTFEGYPRIVEKKKRWEHCGKPPSKRFKQTAKSDEDCCGERRGRKDKAVKFAMISVFEKPCTFPKLDIVPRHCLTKQKYIDMLATPSRKCPPDCHKKMILRKLKPVSPRIKELALPTRQRMLITLQEGAATLPPALLDNLVRTLEDETCITPEQAAAISRKKKFRKKGKARKNKWQFKETSKPRKSRKSSTGVASAGSTFDKDSVTCQYLIAERFVRSILKWKCSVPAADFNDISEVIIGRLIDTLEYDSPENEDRKSQQVSFLADAIACWVTGVLSEVARNQEKKLMERCQRKEEEIKADEETDEDEEEDEEEEDEDEVEYKRRYKDEDDKDKDKDKDKGRDEYQDTDSKEIDEGRMEEDRAEEKDKKKRDKGTEEEEEEEEEEADVVKETKEEPMDEAYVEQGERDTKREEPSRTEAEMGGVTETEDDTKARVEAKTEIESKLDEKDATVAATGTATKLDEKDPTVAARKTESKLDEKDPTAVATVTESKLDEKDPTAAATKTESKLEEKDPTAAAAETESKLEEKNPTTPVTEAESKLEEKDPTVATTETESKLEEKNPTASATETESKLDEKDPTVAATDTKVDADPVAVAVPDAREQLETDSDATKETDAGDQVTSKTETETDIEPKIGTQIQREERVVTEIEEKEEEPVEELPTESRLEQMKEPIVEDKQKEEITGESEPPDEESVARMLEEAEKDEEKAVALETEGAKQKETKDPSSTLPVEDAAETEIPKDVIKDLNELFKSDIPFLTFGKIIDTVYKMIEDTPENTGEDPITNGIHRAIYEKLKDIAMLEDPELLTEELKDVMYTVCGKIANWLRSILSKSQLDFMKQFVPEVESKEIRDWTNWLSYISDVAKNWNSWLRDVIEKTFEMEGAPITRGEWRDWTKSVDAKALLWRRFHLRIKHRAHRNVTAMSGRRVIKSSVD